MDFDGFDWDEGNRDKCCKHGMSVEEIEEALAKPDLVSEDLRHSMGEQRFLAVGRARGRFAYVVFTYRTRGALFLLRPVSARFMHDKEVRRYVKKDCD